MREIKAPARPLNIDPTAPSIFMAGSIDMGKAEDWQTQLASSLKDHNVVLFNPRRVDWDSSWVQDISNDQFREQVEWEMEHLDKASIIVFYFDPKGQAPITLLELGLHATREDQLLVVCCPEGFWRHGNVQIVCNKHNIPMVPNLDGIIQKINQFVEHLEDNNDSNPSSD